MSPCTSGAPTITPCCEGLCCSRFTAATCLAGTGVFLASGAWENKGRSKDALAKTGVPWRGVGGAGHFPWELGKVRVGRQTSECLQEVGLGEPPSQVAILEGLVEVPLDQEVRLSALCGGGLPQGPVWPLHPHMLPSWVLGTLWVGGLGL